MDKSTVIFSGGFFCPPQRMFRESALYSIFAASLPDPYSIFRIFRRELIFMENTVFTNRKNVFLLLKERMCR